MARMDAAWTAALAADANAASLGPYVAGDADTESVNNRFVAGVPNQYVELVMNHQDSTPHTFWDVVISQVHADGNGATCSATVNWARVACTLSAANTNVLHGHAPQPFVPDVFFRQRLMAKIDRDIPVMTVTNASTFPDVATQAITNLCALHASKVGKKTIKESKKGLFEVLCKFMETNNEKDFPLFGPSLQKLLRGIASPSSMASWSTPPKSGTRNGRNPRLPSSRSLRMETMPCATSMTCSRVSPFSTWILLKRGKLLRLILDMHTSPLT
jgi:hypothetical protein